MNIYEIMAITVTLLGAISFAVIFTILYNYHANSLVDGFRSGIKDVDIIDEEISALKKGENRKGVKIAKIILQCVIIAIIVPTLFFSVYSKFSKGIVMIGGKGVVVVGSGSMSKKNSSNQYLFSNNLSNQLQTYDIIALKKVKKDEIKPFDIIAYKNDKGVIIIHRIREIAEDGSYITRGDSNNRDDSCQPSYDDVLGVYTGRRIRYLGMFVMFLQSYAGILTIMAIIYCMIIMNVIPAKIQRARNKRLKILKQAFDFSAFENSDRLCSEISEKIYFKDSCYIFNEDGFVRKEDISPDEIDKKIEKTLLMEEKFREKEENPLKKGKKKSEK